MTDLNLELRIAALEAAVRTLADACLEKAESDKRLALTVQHQISLLVALLNRGGLLGDGEWQVILSRTQPAFDQVAAEAMEEAVREFEEDQP